MNILDTFAGAGGFSLGFEQAGDYKVVGAIEKDSWACETFQYNHPNSKVIGDSIENLTDEEIKNYFSNIDVVLGGPPCQGFSIANKKSLDPKDPRNSLFKEFIRVGATSGYREENEYRKATLSFDEEINLKMESEVKDAAIYNLEEEVKNGEPFCQEMEEVNLLEYIFICPYCKKKITAYNDDPSLDYNQGSFEKQINFDYNKEIWYDSTKHNNEQISLSIDELIENTRYELAGKNFSVGYIFMLHDMTFKHRGGSENFVADNIDDMLEADSDNIEHGVQGLSRTIVYASIEVE